MSQPSPARTSVSKLAVLIPAAQRDDVVDTVDSVVQLVPDATVVVLNDGERSLARLARLPQVTVLPPLPYPRNAFGGLWAKVCYGLRWILENDSAEVVLRLDADALVLRRGLEDAVESALHVHPDSGVLGSYRFGPDGGRRDFGPAAAVIKSSCGFRGYRRPLVRRRLRPLIRAARAHGYADGDHAIACAVLLRRTMVEEWERNGWLAAGGPLSRSMVADDFMIGLCAKAAGYNIVDIGGPGGIFALDWKKLPAAPEELLAIGAYVTHSVRRYQDLDEHSIRKFFAEARAFGGSLDTTL